MKLILFISFIIKIIIANLNLFNLKETLPNKWDKTLSLEYKFNAGRQSEFLYYHIKNNTLTCTEKKLTDKHQNTIDINLPDGELNKLLIYLDHIKLHKVTGVKRNKILQDGVAYSFILQRENKIILNISNSACETLTHEGQIKLQLAVSYINNLKTKHSK